MTVVLVFTVVWPGILSLAQYLLLHTFCMLKDTIRWEWEILRW